MSDTTPVDALRVFVARDITARAGDVLLVIVEARVCLGVEPPPPARDPRSNTTRRPGVQAVAAAQQTASLTVAGRPSRYNGQINVKSRLMTEKTAERDQMVLGMLRKHGPLSTNKMLNLLGVHRKDEDRRRLRQHIARMRNAKLILPHRVVKGERGGGGKGTRYIWRLPPGGSIAPHDK